MHVSEMLETSPGHPFLSNEFLITCIEACFDCAQSCNACADACLGEQAIDTLRRCIRLNQDCADICLATGRVLSRQQHADIGLVCSQLETCRLACRVSRDECAAHAKHHEHCRVCAEACRTCAKACQDAIEALCGTGARSATRGNG